MKVALFSYTDLGREALGYLRKQGHEVIAVLPSNRGAEAETARQRYDELDIPHVVDRSRDHHDALATALEETDVDLGLVVGHPHILAPEVIDVFPRGCLNVHPGLLPEFRGQHVINWAIITQADRTGLALHEVTEEVDAGPVVAQDPVDIGPRETAATLNEKLRERVRPLLERALPPYLQGDIDPTPQDESQATVWPARTPEDGEIQPGMTAAEADALVRGLVPPWPGAWLTQDDVRWTLYEARPLEEGPADRPASLTWHPEHGLVLQCSDGALTIQEAAADGEPVPTAPGAASDPREHPVQGPR